jgi:hypothetical protein
MRPQALTMACLMLACLALIRGRYGWLPPLFLVWTNLHGAVVLGLVALVAAGAADAVTMRRVPTRLIAVTAACAAMTLLSPLGFQLWTFIAESTARSRTYELIEWLPPDFRAELLPFWAMAAAIPGLALVRWPSLDLQSRRLTAISLAMLPLALGAVRNVSVFMLVAVPAASALMAGSRLEANPAGRRRDARLLNTAILAVAIATGSVAVGMAWLRPPKQLGWQPLSPDAIEAVRNCDFPLYNTYGDGGPLIWFVPEVPVFIDNRQDPYPPDLLAANLALETTGSYTDVFEQYRIRCAILPIESAAARNLERDPRWSRIHVDERHVVLTAR